MIDQWCSVAYSEIARYTDLIVAICRGTLVPYSKPVSLLTAKVFRVCSWINAQMQTTWTERQIKTLKVLEEHLQTRTYFVGERITVADITLASTIQRAFERTLDATVRAQFPNVIRFLETITHHPKMYEAFGDTYYVDKAIAYTPPPKEKKEPAKPPPAPAPKAEKKPKKEVDDDDEDDNLVPEEPKQKNPLDSLPKSNFNLEDWKRAYSNMDTRGAGGAIEWFYER